MALETWYTVQIYVRGSGRKLAIREARDCKSADEAERIARSFEGSQTIAGAVAFSRSGDYELGEYDEPVILAHTGEVPQEMLAMPY